MGLCHLGRGDGVLEQTSGLRLRFTKIYYVSLYYAQETNFLALLLNIRVSLISCREEAVSGSSRSDE